MLESGKLTILKSDVRAGRTASLIALMEETTDRDDLTTIREQKLLLIAADAQNQKTLAQAYGQAACRLLEGECATRTQNYARFSVHCTRSFSRISREIAERLSKLKKLSKKDILTLAEHVLRDCAKGVNSSRTTAIESHIRDTPDDQSEILFSSSRVRLETIQRIGRCLRTDPNNPLKRANIVDFIRINEIDAPAGDETSDEARRVWLSHLSTIEPEPMS